MALGSTVAVAGIGAVAADRLGQLELAPGSRCSGSTAVVQDYTEPVLDGAGKLGPSWVWSCTVHPCSRRWGLHGTDHRLLRSVPEVGSWCWSELVVER